jgi:hypothetical protein
LAAAGSSVQDVLQRHSEAIRSGRSYRERCSRCDATGGFRRHELRRRQLRVIADLTVQVHAIVIARLRCSQCRCVFTDFPSFVLPYRRYAGPSLMPLARDYLERDDVSYQKAVAPRGRVIGYVTPPGQEEIDERALHRSTLWRFVLFLGAQNIALQAGMRLWSEHDPLSTLHRFSGAVAPHKYRSDQRHEILRTARRLLELIRRWNRAFVEPFFPRFATRARVP